MTREPLENVPVESDRPSALRRWLRAADQPMRCDLLRMAGAHLLRLQRRRQLQEQYRHCRPADAVFVAAGLAVLDRIGDGPDMARAENAANNDDPGSCRRVATALYAYVHLEMNPDLLPLVNRQSGIQLLGSGETEWLLRLIAAEIHRAYVRGDVRHAMCRCIPAAELLRTGRLAGFERPVAAYVGDSPFELTTLLRDRLRGRARLARSAVTATAGSSP